MIFNKIIIKNLTRFSEILIKIFCKPIFNNLNVFCTSNSHKFMQSYLFLHKFWKFWTNYVIPSVVLVIEPSLVTSAIYVEI